MSQLNNLKSGTVDVWSFKLFQPPPILSHFIDTLSEDEKCKMNQYKTTLLKNKYLVGRGTLRNILTLYLHIEAKNIIFNYGKNGKPELSMDSSIFFNMSHSGEHALVGISEAPIGIDIEYMDRKANFDSLAPLIMTNKEKEKFYLLRENEKISAFYRLWTRKEAFVKCLGQGLYYDLKNCYTGIESIPELYEKNNHCFRPYNWFIQDITQVNNDFKAAVVVSKPEDLSINYIEKEWWAA